MTGEIKMAYDNILYETDEGMAVLTLNRPERLNALSRGLLAEYVEALRAAERDDAVRVVVVRGAGRSFCAGYDVPRQHLWNRYSTGLKESFCSS